MFRPADAALRVWASGSTRRRENDAIRCAPARIADAQLGSLFRYLAVISLTYSTPALQARAHLPTIPSFTLAFQCFQQFRGICFSLEVSPDILLRALN